MIRLRKHDKKMLKVAGSLLAAILIMLGLVGMDMRHGHNATIPAPNNGNNVNTQDMEHSAIRDVNFVEAEYKHPVDTDVSLISDQATITTKDAVVQEPNICGSYDSVSGIDGTAGPTSAIPEPSTLAITGVGMLILLGRRRAMSWFKA